MEIRFAKPDDFLYRTQMARIQSDPAGSFSDSLQGESVPGEGDPFLLAHFSDLHITCTDQIKLHHLANKRFFGYLMWRLHRGKKYKSEILSVLEKDLRQIKPDHVLITGDLTHLSLPAEFMNMEKWLGSLGPPKQVTVVPGNHDAYVRTEWGHSFARWVSYMISDASYQTGGAVSGLEDIFPILRIRGRIALIGVCSAFPCAPHLAIGRVGAPQLKKLEKVLAWAAGRNFFRIIAIHHPPIGGVVSRRKRLTDGKDFRSLLDTYGAELVVHGHSHRTTYRTLPTSSGHIPVVGAPSASTSEVADNRRACYYLYRVAPSNEGWEVRITERVYSKNQRHFLQAKNRSIRIPLLLR